MRFDPFMVLDVPATATIDEAKAAYRRLAAIFHPDRFVDSRDEVRGEAEKQMKRLNLAWAVVQARLGDGEATSAGPQARSWEAEQQRRSMWDEDFGERARHARTREQARRRRSEAEQRTR